MFTVKGRIIRGVQDFQRSMTWLRDVFKKRLSKRSILVTTVICRSALI